MLAVSVGLGVFFQPEKIHLQLANFMGMHWLGIVIINLRWGLGRAMLAGVIGILAGIAMLGRIAVHRWGIIRRIRWLNLPIFSVEMGKKSVRYTDAKH